MSWQDERAMTRKQYRETIAQLGLTQAGAGRYLGVSERTAHRYVSGDAEVPASAALLLRSLIHHNEQPIAPAWVRPYKLKPKRKSR